MSEIYISPDEIVKNAISAILDKSGPGTYVVTFMANFGFNKKTPGDFYYDLNDHSITATCISTGYEKSPRTGMSPTTTYSIVIEKTGPSPSAAPKKASKRSRT